MQDEDKMKSVICKNAGSLSISSISERSNETGRAQNASDYLVSQPWR